MALIDNTFRMKVFARQWIDFTSEQMLRDVLETHRDERILVVGGCSNLLFTSDYDGLILHSAMRKTTIVEENDTHILLQAESGIVLDELIAETVEKGWGGLENLSHIPGEVGASAVQNVGAYGVEAKDVIVSVRAMEIATGAIRVFTNADCQFAYRDSIFKNTLVGKYVILSVIYRLAKTPSLCLDYGNLHTAMEGQPLTPASVRKVVTQVRQTKLPEVTELGSAGSFFKNPVISEELFLSLQHQYPTMPSYVVKGGIKVPAAWLIDQCGLRGYQIGDAAVYEKQPLVLVNKGTASPTDIIALANHVIASVQSRFGITLSPEVNYI